MLYQLSHEASLEAGQVQIQFIPVMTKMTWWVYDKDHMSALRIKNTSELSDPHSYEVTEAVTNTSFVHVTAL